LADIVEIRKEFDVTPRSFVARERGTIISVWRLSIRQAYTENEEDPCHGQNNVCGGGFAFKECSIGE